MAAEPSVDFKVHKDKVRIHLHLRAFGSVVLSHRSEALWEIGASCASPFRGVSTRHSAQGGVPFAWLAGERGAGDLSPVVVEASGRFLSEIQCI